MKGDFTRRTFRPEKHYTSVRMQQGRVQVDADWNEQVEIQEHIARSRAQDMIGRAGVPSRTPNGFRVNLDSNEITIDPGRIYVDGIACDLDAKIKFTEQPDFPGAKIEAENPVLVYIEVWEQHVTAIDDPEIVEVALGGPDTATRTRIVWQVKLLPVKDDQEARTIDLDAVFSPPRPPNVKLDTIAPAGNQLYRIEIHDKSSDNKGTGATVKWSRDNGSVVAQWTNNTVPADVDGLGRVRFEENQIIELTDDAHELRGEPGELRTIRKIDNTAGKQTLTLDAVTGTYTTGRKVRRWDSTAITIKPSAAGNDFVSLPGGGIQVAFFEGRYKPGDAWLIPVRQGGIRSNVATPAEGPRRYAKLALITQSRQNTNVIDLRAIFSPLSALSEAVGLREEFEILREKLEYTLAFRPRVAVGTTGITNLRFALAGNQGIRADFPNQVKLTHFDRTRDKTIVVFDVTDVPANSTSVLFHQYLNVNNFCVLFAFLTPTKQYKCILQEYDLSVAPRKVLRTVVVFTIDNPPPQQILSSVVGFRGSTQHHIFCTRSDGTLLQFNIPDNVSGPFTPVQLAVNIKMLAVYSLLTSIPSGRLLAVSGFNAIFSRPINENGEVGEAVPIGPNLSSIAAIGGYHDGKYHHVFVAVNESLGSDLVEIWFSDSPRDRMTARIVERFVLANVTLNPVQIVAQFNGFRNIVFVTFNDGANGVDVVLPSAIIR